MLNGLPLPSQPINGAFSSVAIKPVAGGPQRPRTPLYWLGPLVLGRLVVPNFV